jgi:nuclease S1
MQRLACAMLSFLACLHSAAPVRAWGHLGHRVIGRLAERHLSESARAGLVELLEPGESLADASTWADEHRRVLPGSAAWHYANVPLDAPGYDDRLAGEGQVVPKIREFRAIVADRTRPIGERRLALRLLVHLIEDLHQPLHVGDAHDRGGNSLQVRFFQHGTNLHHVWDSLMMESWSPDEDRWLADLVAIDGPANRSSARKGTVERWATESLMAARQAHLDPMTGGWILPGAALGEAYDATNLSLVECRLYQAGIRLAWVLNRTLRPE